MEQQKSDMQPASEMKASPVKGEFKEFDALSENPPRLDEGHIAFRSDEFTIIPAGRNGIDVMVISFLEDAFVPDVARNATIGKLDRKIRASIEINMDLMDKLTDQYLDIKQKIAEYKKNVGAIR